MKSNRPATVFRIIVFLSILTAPPILASEGILDAAVFLCNPIKLTGSIVSGCTRKYPKLKGDASIIMNDWRKRNRADGQRLVGSCRSQLQAISENSAELQDQARKMQQLETKWLREISKQVKADSQSACEERLNRLSSGKEDLKQFIEPLRSTNGPIGEQ